MDPMFNDEWSDTNISMVKSLIMRRYFANDNYEGTPSMVSPKGEE
jgi:hypothetical protein